MNKLQLQLQSKNILNQVDDDVLKKNEQKIIKSMGGIRNIIKNHIIHENYSNFIDTLQSIPIPKKKNNFNLQHLNDNMIQKITNYLSMDDIILLKNCCLSLSVVCLMELDKIELDILDFSKLIFNKKLILEEDDYNYFFNKIRVNENLSINALNKKYYPKHTIFLYYQSNKILPKLNVPQNAINQKFKYINCNKKFILLKKNTDVLLKFFDVKTQEYYIIDIINRNIINKKTIKQYIFTLLSKPKFKIIFDDIFKNINKKKKKALFELDEFVKYYKQNRINKIKEIWNSNNMFNIDNFDKGTCLSFQFHFPSKIVQLWKHDFKDKYNDNIPFFDNLQTFIDYQLRINKIKNLF